jgi:hypothetical protein
MYMEWILRTCEYKNYRCVSVLPGSEEHAADTTVALPALQEVRLGQEMSQLQGRMHTLHFYCSLVHASSLIYKS